MVSLCPSDDCYGLASLGSMDITGKLVGEMGFLYSVSDSRQDLFGRSFTHPAPQHPYL